MRTLRVVLVALALTIVMGAGAMGQSDDANRPTGGCEAPLSEPGDYADTYAVGDGTAKYWVVVPETYTEEAPVPLVLWLSSGDGDADTHYIGWKPYLDDVEVLFVVVGRTGAWDRDSVLALIDGLEHDFCIDPRRIHLMGGSSSALTLGRLVCEASERIASFYGSMGYFNPSMHCTPERAVPLMATTGDPDREVVTQSVVQWAEWNGCEAKPLMDDLGSGVTRHRYQSCEADVVLIDIEDAGHNYVFHECIGPASSFCREYAEVDELDDSLAFFEQHPLPAE